VQSSWVTSTLRKRLDLPQGRSLPHPSPFSLKSWWRKKGRKLNPLIPKETVTFFNDEFTNHLDAEIGIKMIQVLQQTGYAVDLVTPKNSGRAAISLGDLERARTLAEQNVKQLSKKSHHFITGLEPSTLLGIKDEYPLLVREQYIAQAKALALKTKTFSELLLIGLEKGQFSADLFDQKERKLTVHVHCHQKALSDTQAVARLLSLPKGHQVDLLDTGCCGMAGAYGYPAKNYKMSQAIAETILYPAIRKSPDRTVVATGTSCRHQILDGLNVTAYHTAEILYDALAK